MSVRKSEKGFASRRRSNRDGAVGVSAPGLAAAAAAEVAGLDQEGAAWPVVTTGRSEADGDRPAHKAREDLHAAVFMVDSSYARFGL